MESPVLHAESLAGYTLALYHDATPDSPRDWDNLGIMACWHRRYQLGDQHSFAEPKDLEAYLKVHQAIWVPLYLYDHSGLTLSTHPFSCPWDSGPVGYLYVTPEKVRAEYHQQRISLQLRRNVLEVLRGEVATYDQYLRGEVFGYVVCGPDGAPRESCWGFYGYEYCLEEARKDVQWCLEKDPKIPCAA